jgi:hypothetical protein
MPRRLKILLVAILTGMATYWLLSQMLVFQMHPKSHLHLP